MKKIFIGTPAYSGNVSVDYLISLVDTVRMLEFQGFEVQMAIPISGSLLIAERNKLLKKFLDSDADYFLGIDNDLGWDPRSVLRLIKSNKEFSGGCYPTRSEEKNFFFFRPILNEDSSIKICEETGLLEMEYIPAGFILLKKSAIEKMIKKFPEKYYCPKKNDSEDGYCLFETEVWEGEFWGEDYVFCRRAREAGLKIYIDPSFNFKHGSNSGNILQILTEEDPSKGKN